MSNNREFTMASEAADLAYAYCMFDGSLGRSIQLSSTAIILEHDVLAAGGQRFGKEIGEDYVSARFQLPGRPAVTAHFDLTDKLTHKVQISVHEGDTYRDNNGEPI